MGERGLVTEWGYLYRRARPRPTEREHASFARSLLCAALFVVSLAQGFDGRLDALSRCPQHGVAVLAHVLERGDPQRLELGLLK